MTTITAHTRPNGKSIIIEARDADGRRIANTVTKSVGYEYLVVHLWNPDIDGVAAKLRVWKRTDNLDVARRVHDGRPNAVVLRRHSDGTYTPRDGGWRDHQDAIRAAKIKARWLAERDPDRHQVLVDLPDGRTVRVGDPTRHFTYDQALARHEVTPDSYVRSEADPKYADVEWATPADLALVGAS
jgi:hypothetical protein